MQLCTWFCVCVVNADSRHDVDGSAITLDVEASDTMDNVKAKQATRGSQDTAGLQLPEGGTLLLRQSALRPRWRRGISSFHLEGQRFGVTRTKTLGAVPRTEQAVWGVGSARKPRAPSQNRPIAIACDRRNCFQRSPTMSFARKKRKKSSLRVVSRFSLTEFAKTAQTAIP